jgi:hypothetical protein
MNFQLRPEQSKGLAQLGTLSNLYLQPATRAMARIGNQFEMLLWRLAVNRSS